MYDGVWQTARKSRVHNIYIYLCVYIYIYIYIHNINTTTTAGGRGLQPHPHRGGLQARAEHRVIDTILYHDLVLHAYHIMLYHTALGHVVNHMMLCFISYTDCKYITYILYYTVLCSDNYGPHLYMVGRLLGFTARVR